LLQLEQQQCFDSSINEMSQQQQATLLLISADCLLCFALRTELLAVPVELPSSGS
jgi:hypothetical protein